MRYLSLVIAAVGDLEGVVEQVQKLNEPDQKRQLHDLLVRELLSGADRKRPLRYALASRIARAV